MAIAATSIVIALGFSVVSLASLKSVALFGILTAVTMLSALVAELLVTPVLWPDFRERQLLLAVDDYLGRERRFGGLPGCPATAEDRRDSSLLDPARWKRLLGHRS